MVVDKVKTNTPSEYSNRDTLTFSGISGSLWMKTLRTVLGSSSSGSPVDHACLARRPDQGFSGVKWTCFLSRLKKKKKAVVFLNNSYPSMYQCVSWLVLDIWSGHLCYKWWAIESKYFSLIASRCTSGFGKYKHRTKLNQNVVRGNEPRPL